MGHANTGYDLKVRVAVEAASAVTSVVSPSHSSAVTVAVNDAVVDNAGRNKAVVTLGANGGAGLGTDLVLVIAQEQPHQARVWVEDYVDDRGVVSGETGVAGGGSGAGAGAGAALTSPTKAVMVALYPDLSSVKWRSESVLNFVFVVDRSGSMGGWKMQAAKRTLQLCLRSLPEGALFQIVSFGSSFELLFTDGSQEYTEATLARATAYVDGMSASMGTLLVSGCLGGGMGGVVES